MKQFIDRLWYSTTYPGVWYIPVVILYFVWDYLRQPIDNLSVYIQDNVDKFDNYQIAVFWIIFAGLIALMFLTIYVNAMVIYLNVKGWREYVK